MAPRTDLRQHLIWRLHREVRRQERPVTFREIYKHSRRDREAMAAELEALVSEGLVAAVEPPEGAVGRPTVYFHLVNEWAPDPDASPLVPHRNRLAPTERPNPHADHEFKTHQKKEVFTEFSLEGSKPHELFLVLGPRMFAMVRDGKVSDPKEQVWGKFVGTNDVSDAEAVEVWNRLASAAYDEYFTEFGIVTSKAERGDGTRDRRVGGGTGQYYVPRGRAAEISDTPKSVQQRQAQERLAKHVLKIPEYAKYSVEEMVEIMRDRNNYPVPNDDLPDMSHFAAMLGRL